MDALNKLQESLNEALSFGSGLEECVCEIIRNVEDHVTKLAKREKEEMAAMKDDEDMQLKWPEHKVEACITGAQELNIDLVAIISELESALPQAADLLPVKVSPLLPPLQQKARALAERLQIQDEAYPGSPYTNEVAEVQNMVEALMRAEAISKFEVLLQQIRLHDPAYVVIQCHHGAEANGHVRYSERWGIGDLGAERLAAAVSGVGNPRGHNPYVKALYLQGNGITSAGVMRLVDGIKSCPQIDALNLQGNKIGSEGATTIAEGVKEGRLPLTLF